MILDLVFWIVQKYGDDSKIRHGAVVVRFDIGIGIEIEIEIETIRPNDRERYISPASSTMRSKEGNDPRCVDDVVGECRPAPRSRGTDRRARRCVSQGPPADGRRLRDRASIRSPRRCSDQSTLHGAIG